MDHPAFTRWVRKLAVEEVGESDPRLIPIFGDMIIDLAKHAPARKRAAWREAIDGLRAWRDACGARDPTARAGATVRILRAVGTIFPTERLGRFARSYAVNEQLAPALAVLTPAWSQGADARASAVRQAHRMLRLRRKVQKDTVVEAITCRKPRNGALVLIARCGERIIDPDSLRRRSRRRAKRPKIT